MRVDVMTRMRGVAAFPSLWARRSTFTLPDGTRCDVMSVSDLVRAKKTQRDKDWPMIRRLVEAHYFSNIGKATVVRRQFWFNELRTPELLIDLATRFPAQCRQLARHRKLLTAALSGNANALQKALHKEESSERRQDQRYWRPLRKELEALRHSRLV
jgi:hypothetical protein